MCQGCAPLDLEVLFDDNEPNDKKWKLWLEKMLVGRDGCLAGQWQLRVLGRARTPASELLAGSWHLTARDTEQPGPGTGGPGARWLCHL